MGEELGSAPPFKELQTIVEDLAERERRKVG
jgi:hypothetical protein